MSGLDERIVEDVRRVAQKLNRTELSRSEYLQHGAFTTYQIYDGGQTWEGYCNAAGLKTKKQELVPDEVYFSRLRKAIEDLGRFPKASERKLFGLNFSKRRYPTLKAFIDEAIRQEIIAIPAQDSIPAKSSADDLVEDHHHIVEAPDTSASNSAIGLTRPVPPIPSETKRTKWERTGVDGFPYAPQDELGVVALFAILCSQGRIEWQILELRGGKGIDATCYDHAMGKEIRVELKHRLSRAGWNHRVEDLDYIVCWETRWPDFPKPVIVLRDLVKGDE